MTIQLFKPASVQRIWYWHGMVSDVTKILVKSKQILEIAYRIDRRAGYSIGIELNDDLTDAIQEESRAQHHLFVALH